MISLTNTKIQNYPIIAIRDGIVFPSAENVLVFGRDRSVNAMKRAMEEEKKVVLVMQKKMDVDEPSAKDLYTTGVIAQIDKIATGEKGQINALVKGLQKVEITAFTQSDPYFAGNIEFIEELALEDEKILAIVKYISGQIKKAINLGKTIDFVFLMNILNIQSSLSFSHQVAMILDIKTEDRQALLEESSLKKRLEKEVELINKEIKVLELEHNISNKTQKKFEKNMRDTFLREKMKTIEEELGDKGDNQEVNEYKKKIKDSDMPKEVREKAVKELKKLAQMSQYNPEASYIRSYLDWLVEIPWQKASEQNIDLKIAEAILDEDHFGLKKVKERILEFLAVMKLEKLDEEKENAKKKKKGDSTEKRAQKRESQPSILCFVGPPGVGKTSLGRSIARALGREFVKISLGGIRDEAEIRGHRRTYVGALPGRMIQGIKQAGTNNPVFMLDEIDKLGRDYRGDPSAALLEALDPEQNFAFSDHYLEVPFDLSKVFFITTANMLDTIPDALRDRLEIIHFAGYTEDEKFSIAKNYLIPKQIKAHHVPKSKVAITDTALELVVRRFTREAGVRELERQVATVLRKIAREIVENKIRSKKSVKEQDVQKYLGPYKYSAQMIEEHDTVGIATGLAWTQAGGDILFIEVSTMPGKGGLTLTGNLGDVMKESCQAALTYIRSRWDLFNIDKKFFSETDIHVHVPEGAVPKDGPSAGVSIVSSMVSALTGIPVKRDVAMTGEITLRGRVTEIGGLKEKIIAAHRAQIKTVIVPEENRKDLVDIPKNVQKDLKFVFAKRVDDVLNVSLAFPTKKKIYPSRPQLQIEKEKEPVN